MPNVWATKTGNWSDTTVWNTGVLPTASDAVWASGSTVTINQNITVQTLNTFASGTIGAGGGFTIAASSPTVQNIVCNGNITAGTTPCLTVNSTDTPGTMSIQCTTATGGGSANAYSVYINGTRININITGSSIGGAGSNAHGIYLSGNTNIMNVSGSTFTGGSGGTSHGILLQMNASQGISTINISGSIIGGTTTNTAAGLGVSNMLQNAVININGNVSSSATSYGLYYGSGANTSIITTTINGNVTSAAGSTAFVAQSSPAASFIINGNVTGSSAASNYGIVDNSAAGHTITINGSVVGGSNATGPSYGVYNQSAGVIIINGNVTGGTGATTNYGAYNNSTGVIIINGTAAGNTATGAYNVSTGVLRVITAAASTSSYGLFNTSVFGTASFQSMTFGPSGFPPMAGNCLLITGSNNFASCSLSTSGYKILVGTDTLSTGYPSTSNVRLGKAYNFGSSIGTLAIPSASQVASGTFVDNTTGSAIFIDAIASTMWNAPTSSLTIPDSIGERFRNVATVDSTGNQIATLTI